MLEIQSLLFSGAKKNVITWELQNQFKRFHFQLPFISYTISVIIKIQLVANNFNKLGKITQKS